MKTLSMFMVITLALLPAQPAPKRQVCFTIDDLPWVSAVPSDHQAVATQTRVLLSSLVAHKIPAIGFVNEQKLASNGSVDPRRVRLLQYWLDVGMELGKYMEAVTEYYEQQSQVVPDWISQAGK